MSDLLTETEDAIRRERIENIWHNHKRKIITAIAALIIGTGIVSAYDHWDYSQNIQSTNAMLALTEAENFPENITPETELKIRPGIKGLLLIKTANAYLEKEKPEVAMEIYNRITQDSSLEQNIKDLAILSKTRLQTNQDNPDIAALIKQIEPIVNRKDSAYNPAAIIDSAALHARLSDYETAIALLEQIKNSPGLTETLYLKTQSLSHLYEIKKGETNETP